MARVKGGYTTHRRHKKILDSVKGHSGSRHRRFKVAKKSNIELDRKTLSLLAYNDFEAFEKIVQESSSVKS